MTLRFALRQSKLAQNKGDIGAVLALSELDNKGNNISAKAVIVDGKTIKANTWYTLKNGEFVEV